MDNETARKMEEERYHRNWLDEETARIVERYVLAKPARKMEEERCHRNWLNLTEKDLLIGKEKLCERIDFPIRKRARKKFQKEYQRLKNEGKKEYVDYQQQVNDGWELETRPIEYFVEDKMRKMNYRVERVDYLKKMLGHEGLMKNKTKENLRGILGNLCAETCANLYHGDLRNQIYETGYKALESVTSKQTARELMSEWESREESRIEDSFDI